MPTRYKDYPIYTYDEPAVYNKFSNGINSDPSNDHLVEGELRDCVNMHYLSGALVKRKGAKKLCDVICEDNIDNIQGVFLFTYKLTYIIVASNGKLYQGVYNDNTNIYLNRLRIKKYLNYSDLMFDPEDCFATIEEKDSEFIDKNYKHDGYVVTNITNLLTGETIVKNFRGSFSDVEGGSVNVGDVFTGTLGNLTVEYLCIKDFEVNLTKPGDDENVWIEQPVLFETEVDGNTIQLNSTNVTDEQLIQCGIKRFTEKDTWNVGDVCLYGSGNNARFFLCVEDYTYTSSALTNTELFYCMIDDGISDIKYKETKELIFQNYKKIEAATLNNKLYITTGTLFIEVGLKEDELYAKPVEPYLLNYTEVEKIGYNYMSPYPELAVASQKETATTSIKAIKVDKLIGGRFRLSPVMNIQIGDSIDNYYFRWEKFIDGKWYVIIPFSLQKLADKPNDYSSITVDDADETNYRVTFARAFEDEANLQTLDYYFETKEDAIDEDTGKQYTKTVQHFSTVQDYTVDKVTGEYFGSATSTKFNNNLQPEDTYKVIQSCTRITTDGQKLLLYSDRYNSGQWYKTIINNPGYITDRGCLSFKTTKNEEVVKVVPFQGNIIVFANSENIGGSIHIVKGNGDDYDDQSGYYSPYQRSTINASISCDNYETIQICDNILVFKYFDRVYYINASDLNNDVVKVNPCNDRIRTQNKEVNIPWDDNECVSEVTDSYYALMWKEKYIKDENGNLFLDHPGIRIKMYYKMASKLDDESYTMPWLRDIGKVFNSRFIIYIKGKPVYFVNNMLITFDEENYNDLGDDYDCVIHFRGEGLNYPSQFKLIENVLFSFHRNQYNKIDLDVIIRNEAGHILIDSNSKLKSIGDLGALKAGDSLRVEQKRLDTTIQDTKLFNSVNMFPCLLADAKLTVKTSGKFVLSSVTYNYTSTETPDQNPYDTYVNIIRPKEV